MFYRSEEPGDYITYEFVTPDAGEYELSLVYTRYPSYGEFSASLNGGQAGEPVDAYFASLDAGAGRVELGVHTLRAGPNTIRLELTGRNTRADDAFIGVCDLLLRPVEGESP